MKLTLIVCVALVAIAVVECATHCMDASDCACKHEEVATCDHHTCVCTHNGIGKRQHQHTCTDDTSCANYDCTHHGGGTPFCDHHGPNEHGHSLCNCK